MGASREKTQADFDLQRVMDLLDTALTSTNPSVQDSLRQLLVIVTLTQTQEDGKMAISTNRGPLRQMQEDIRNLNRMLNSLSSQVDSLSANIKQPTYYPNTQPGTGLPTPNPWPIWTTGTGTGTTWGTPGHGSMTWGGGLAATNTGTSYDVSTGSFSLNDATSYTGQYSLDLQSAQDNVKISKK